MKIIYSLLICSCCLASAGFSQNGKVPPVDKSPMDMSYYPPNYPILKIQDKDSSPLLMRVIYSRPQKNGREVFGELIGFGDIWRMGANEATEIEFFKDGKFGNTKIKKGRYTMYAIPNPGKWTVIINKENDIWGAFKYDATKDIARYDVSPEVQTDTVEDFSMIFTKGDHSTVLLNVYWDHYKVAIPFVF